MQGTELEIPLNGKDQLKGITNTFVTKVTAEVDNRFPEEDTAVTKDLASVLDPKQLPARQEGLVNHGKRRRSFREIGVDAKEAQRSFLPFK